MFAMSLAIVFILFRLGKADANTMFMLFVAGNVFYYAVGIVLATLLQDNRAFCKYICPITVFLKPMSYFSLLRIKCDEAKCIHCDKCLKVCPMEVEVNNNSRKRKNATECILCQQCKKVCPVGALK
jgi:polyferredoxin